jgi:hypothetical protein
MHAVPRPRMTSTAPLLRGGGELHVVRSDDVVTFEDPEGAMQRLVELADGSRSTQELYRALASDYPQLRHDDVVDAVARLEAAGLVEPAPPRRDLGGTEGGLFSG